MKRARRQEMYKDRYQCSRCGARLDPGERCDCCRDKEKETKEKKRC